MKVDYKQVERHDGANFDMPYIFGGQYIDLFYSMVARKELSPDLLSNALHQISGQLDIAIAARSTVHEWHKLLPAAEARVKDNDSHGDFLDKLKRLREAISRQMHQSP